MKIDKRKRKIILLFSILLFLIFLIFLIVLINSVIIPSYQSYAAVCEPDKFDDSRYFTAGQVITITYENGTEEIRTQIFVNDSETIKHELCHVSQAKREYWLSNSCSTPIQKYFLEVECYIAEELPDPIFKMFYEDYGEL